MNARSTRVRSCVFRYETEIAYPRAVKLWSQHPETRFTLRRGYFETTYMGRLIAVPAAATTLIIILLLMIQMVWNF